MRKSTTRAAVGVLILKGTACKVYVHDDGYVERDVLSVCKATRENIAELGRVLKAEEGTLTIPQHGGPPSNSRQATTAGGGDQKAPSAESTHAGTQHTTFADLFTDASAGYVNRRGLASQGFRFFGAQDSGETV